MPKLVFDTQRSFDSQGFLHVKETPITKAGVREYMGRELPAWQEMGLDPDKIYGVFCPPEELETAAHTFDGLPVLLEHAPESADKPQKDLRVGSVGSSGKFSNPYLSNYLTITDQRAIDFIEAGERVELSASYSFIPEKKSGTYNGQPYDVIMRNIKGNHVALVPEGRAGSDVRVADQKPEISKGKKNMDKEKILSALAHIAELIKGAEDDVKPPVQDDTTISNAAENDDAKKVSEKVTDEEILETPAAPENAENKTKATAAENVVNVKIEKEAADLSEHPGAPEGQVVMDAAIKSMETKLRNSLKEQANAARMCRPFLGDVDPFVYDSAEAIYGAALKAIGCNTSDCPPSAYKGMVRVALDMRGTMRGAENAVVMDAMPDSGAAYDFDDKKMRLPKIG